MAPTARPNRYRIPAEPVSEVETPKAAVPRARFAVLVEVDVPAGTRREQHDDALRLAYSTLGAQLWGGLCPPDATLDVGPCEADPDAPDDLDPVLIVPERNPEGRNR